MSSRSRCIRIPPPLEPRKGGWIPPKHPQPTARWNHGGTPPSHLLKGVQKGFGVSALCRCLRLTPRQPPHTPGVAVPASVQGSAPSPRHLSRERRGFLGSLDSPQRWVRVWDPPNTAGQVQDPTAHEWGGGRERSRSWAGSS